MAHFGWPWHTEAVAITLHKANVHLELSGWAPRYVPDEVVREAEGRLADRVLFGLTPRSSTPARCWPDGRSACRPRPSPGWPGQRRPAARLEAGPP